MTNEKWKMFLGSFDPDHCRVAVNASQSDLDPQRGGARNSVRQFYYHLLHAAEARYRADEFNRQGEKLPAIIFGHHGHR